MQDKQKTKKLSGWNRLLAIVFAITLIFVSLLNVFRNNFSSGAKTYFFLKQANAYENITELAKVEITKNLPKDIKNNFIKKALIEKVVDIVITPENISKIAEPGINNLYKLSSKAADLATKKIEFDTTEIKNQAEQYLPNLGLSSSFTNTTLEFVKSVPDNIVIINVDKKPNSPLAIFLKVRSAYKTLDNITNITWVLALISLIAIILINLKDTNRMMRSLYWTFGISGLIVLTLTYIVPPIATSFLPVGTDANESTAINNLVSGIIDNYLRLVRGYGWLYIVIGLIILLIYWLINSDKLKTYIKNYRKSKRA